MFPTVDSLRLVDEGLPTFVWRETHHFLSARQRPPWYNAAFKGSLSASGLGSTCTSFVSLGRPGNWNFPTAVNAPHQASTFSTSYCLKVPLFSEPASRCSIVWMSAEKLTCICISFVIVTFDCEFFLPPPTVEDL